MRSRLKINAICLILLLLPSGMKGQNLVNNPSFEQTGCGPIPCGWSKPTEDYGTPDTFINGSFSNCYPCDCQENDNTFAGNAHALSGNRFVGGVAYYVQGGQENGRENLQQELSEPLEAGIIYQVGFNIKYGERSKYLIDHFGMHISDSAVGPTNTAPLNDVIPVVPQIERDSTLGHQSNWTLVAGYYTAHGGERYITLGNFTPDDELNVGINPLYTPGSTNCLLTNDAAYIFIDDVFITPVEVIAPPVGYFIYPNPAVKDFFFAVASPWEENLTLSLFDISGREILQRIPLIHEENQINISNLPAGVYTVCFYLGEEALHYEQLLTVR